jgi:hypothetical protein
VTEPTKIEFRYRRIGQLDDITDMVAMLFPSNKNHQHAAARILMILRGQPQPVASLSPLETKHGISRRTLQRVRAKLSRLGLIEHVTWMNRRHAGKTGWLISTRMSRTLRQLADTLDAWRAETSVSRQAKDVALTELIR